MILSGTDGVCLLSDCIPNEDVDNVNLLVLKMFVKKSGVPLGNVTLASGGQEAIDRYKADMCSDSGVDIIFMDLVRTSVRPTFPQTNLW